MKDTPILIPRSEPDPTLKDGLPDPILTPGHVSDLPMEVVMNPGYAAANRRVPGWIRVKVFSRYGIGRKEWSFYDIDHLVPLSLGGTNELNNLWPHAWTSLFNPRKKAKLEGRLRLMVKRKRLQLKEAQQLLMTDWIAAYQRYCGQY